MLFKCSDLSIVRRKLANLKLPELTEYKKPGEIYEYFYFNWTSFSFHWIQNKTTQNEKDNPFFCILSVTQTGFNAFYNNISKCHAHHLFRSVRFWLCNFLRFCYLISFNRYIQCQCVLKVQYKMYSVSNKYCSLTLGLQIVINHGISSHHDKPFEKSSILTHF